MDKIAEELSQSPILKKLDLREIGYVREFFNRNGFKAFFYPESGVGSLHPDLEIPMSLEFKGDMIDSVDLSGEHHPTISYNLIIRLFDCEYALIKWWQFRRRLREFLVFRKLREMLLK